ncbi:MAG: hypothetical protein MUF31_16435 [Akkermansiaceae bacterium]|jgi:hypothetical protein|nr:hypothetical protein [Akkermansiaceae bacterium]
MKSPFAILSTLALLSVASAFASEMKEAPTSEELANRLRHSEQTDPMRNLQIVDEKDPSEAVRPADLVASSDILCHQGTATLVPKGALLAIPAHLKERTQFVAGARIVTWQEFFAANRDWLSTTEITLEQASGRQPLGDALVKTLGESRVIMVATLQQGPISVNPHQPAAPAQETASRP